MSTTKTQNTARTSDGDTLTVRALSRDLVSTSLVVTSQRIAGRGVELLWIDGPLYLVMRSQLVPIRHPDYEYAATKADAARKALAFALDGAESTLAYAEREGIAVEDCY